MLFFFYNYLIYSKGFYCEDVYYDLYRTSHQCCGKYAIGEYDKCCFEKDCSFICNYTKILFQDYYNSACYSSFSYSVCKFINPSIYMMLIIFLFPTIISTSIIIYLTKSLKPLINGLINCLMNLTFAFIFDFFYCKTTNLFGEMDHLFFFVLFIILPIFNFFLSGSSFQNGFLYFMNLKNFRLMNKENLFQTIKSYLEEIPEILIQVFNKYSTNHRYEGGTFYWDIITSYKKSLLLEYKSWRTIFTKINIPSSNFLILYIHKKIIKNYPIIN